MAGSNNVEIIDKSSWPKWQIALAVSAPIAAYFGYYYILKKSKKTDPPITIKSEDKFTVQEPCSKTFSLDKEVNTKDSNFSGETTSEVATKVETPIERALSLKVNGNTLFKSRNYENAIRCYTEAIEICPENERSTLSTFYQNRAAAYEHMQNYNAVIDDCTNALKLDPRYTKALQRRGKAYEQIGDLSHCLEDTTAVCILENFKNDQTLFMADRILQQIGKNNAKKAFENRGVVKLSKHFVKSYFVSFTNDPVVKEYPKDVNGHKEEDDNLDGIEKAKQCLSTGDYEEIIPLCTKELEKNEKSWEALLLRGTILFLMGDQQKALGDFSAIIDGDCSHTAVKTNALIKRASLYLQLETPEINALERFTMSMKSEVFIPEKCMKDFEAAETLDPDNSDIYHHRGQVHLLMDRMDLALDDFKKTLAKKPDLPVVQVQMYYAKYRIATINKDSDTINYIIDQFKQLMKKHPECIEAYTLYIQICTDQQDSQQADEYFKKAIKADPTNATIRVQRATLYLQWKADITKAMELIEEAIEIDERCEYAYEILGTIEVQRGNLTRAISLFEKALQYAKSERELAHIYSLRDAAKAQAVVAERLEAPFTFKPT